MQFDIGPNLETVILALLVALPGIVAAFFARKSAGVAADVSNRIDGRLDAVVTAAHAQGVLAGQAEPHADPRSLAVVPDPNVNNPPKEGT